MKRNYIFENILFKITNGNTNRIKQELYIPMVTGTNDLKSPLYIYIQSNLEWKRP